MLLKIFILLLKEGAVMKRKLPLFLFIFLQLAFCDNKNESSISSFYIPSSVVTTIEDSEFKMSYQDKNYSFNYIEDYDKFTLDDHQNLLSDTEAKDYQMFSTGEITSSGNYYIKGFSSSVTLKQENKEIVHLFLKNLSISDVSKTITVLKRVPKSLGISSSPILMKKETAEVKMKDKTANTIHTLPFLLSSLFLFIIWNVPVK